MTEVYIGNVNHDSKSTRGWFIGHFINDLTSLRHSNDVEIKWDEPRKGTRRDDWSVSETATTMSLVISGKIRMIFEDNEVVLNPGDYYVSPPKIPHKYVIDEDSKVLTVRWPSIPNDHSNKGSQ